jgi:hypothetical protein
MLTLFLNLDLWPLKVDEADSCDATHVWFKGLDPPYDASVPVAKAVSSRGDVLLVSLKPQCYSNAALKKKTVSEAD